MNQLYFIMLDGLSLGIKDILIKKKNIGGIMLNNLAFMMKLCNIMDLTKNILMI